jgi:hypothetical protein
MHSYIVSLDITHQQNGKERVLIFLGKKKKSAYILTFVLRNFRHKLVAQEDLVFLGRDALSPSCLIKNVLIL